MSCTIGRQNKIEWFPRDPKLHVLSIRSSHEFFTLSREVIDISDDIGRLAKQMDPVHIEEGLIRSLLAFTGTLEAVYRLMDCYVDLKTQSLKTSPVEVGLMFTLVFTLSTQPLLSIYQHATFAAKNGPRLSEATRNHPVWYASVHSSFNSPTIQPNCRQPQNHGLSEFVHAHVYISHFCFSRLVRIYTELLSVLWSVMDKWQKVTHFSLDKILLQSQGLLTHKLQREQYRNLEITATYPWQNPTDPVTMVVLSGAVYDVVSENGIPLGSLVAADTWIISTLRVNQAVISRKAINLTGGVQHVCMWTRSPLPLDLTLFDTKLPAMNEQMNLVLPSPGNPVCFPVTCACFEDRIVLHGKRIGTSWFKPERIFHYRPADLEKPDILEFVLPHTDNECSFLSIAVQSSVLPSGRISIKESTESDQPDQPIVQDRSIWLMLRPRTKAKRLFFEQVAPMWRDRGLLTQSDNSPTQLVVEVALKSMCLHREGQNVLSDSVRGDAGRLSPNYHMKFTSLDQLMTHQPTAEAWIEAHRMELRHTEASWCLKASNECVTTPTEYMLRCGVYLTAGKYVAFEDQSACTTLLQNLLLGQSPNNQQEMMSWTGRSVGETNASPTELALQTSRLTEPLVLTVICGTVGSRKPNSLHLIGLFSDLSPM
ncbi:hypothetical protein P879_06808 [Paragonimus westermani]|uniref:DUF7085 domain-containing protein n=1 Tax=Paragonimus westermani TaxID=34504 RepID=A0A8T0DEK6_9TREM|nr:hypothetical protein P879_06808 [Paragonimus westermani]